MNFIDQIVQNIVRPTRDRYHINRLGQKFFNLTLDNHQPATINRFDKQLVNHKKSTLELSYYANSSAEPDTCVIYLHANNGSRIEGLQYLNGLLYARLNVCLFDFSGSGLSGGEYISLGPNQSYDLECVVNYLKRQMKIRRVILWGRSMGACTALIYANRNPSAVQGLILDSPFKDLRKLIKQLGAERTILPKCFFQPLMGFINDSLKEKVGHELDEYKLKRYLNNLQKVPVLFLVSKQDKLVKPHHGQKLYSRYPAKNKNLQYIDIQHHENRTNDIIFRCVNFIRLSLFPKVSAKIPISKKYNDGHITSRTMNSKKSQSSKKQVQNGSLKMEHQMLIGSTRTSMQDLNVNFKLQPSQSKVSLKDPHMKESIPNIIQNEKIGKVLIDNRAKISLAGIMKHHQKI